MVSNKIQIKTLTHNGHLSRFPIQPDMQKLFHFKIQPLFPNPYPNAGKPSSFGYIPLSNRPQIRTPIICAKYNRRRTSGSPKSTRSVLQFVHSVASNFSVLPEPWNSVIRQFGGGNRGGGSGFGKGFGWGGFDGWGWRRRRRGKKGKLGIWGILMAFGLGLWVCFGKKLELDVFIGGLCSSLVLVIANGWNKQGSEWIFGFCCGAAMVGLGLQREDLQKWFKGFRSNLAGRRSKRRRAM